MSTLCAAVFKQLLRGTAVKRAAGLVLVLSVLFAALPTFADTGRDALRVCADPNNLPFSHKNRQGFENKIAELFARQLNLPIEFTWFPQRIGFIRNTLRATEPETERYKCDIVMGVPSGFELTDTTAPYYRSTYALVYVKGGGLDDIASARAVVELPLKRRNALRIGVFAPSPAVDWLLKNGMIEQQVAFQIMSGDPERYPGELIEKELVAGHVDMAIVWGPIAGYFAKVLDTIPVVVILLESEPGIQFDYEMSMGVRHGDREWKREIEALLERTKPEIRKILEEYNVPLLPLGKRPAALDDED
jgi:quinoprotein dehydrogenase-associated probable ABC transporter substrate-binding protein